MRETIVNDDLGGIMQTIPAKGRCRRDGAQDAAAARRLRRRRTIVRRLLLELEFRPARVDVRRQVKRRGGWGERRKVIERMRKIGAVSRSVARAEYERIYEKGR